MNFIAIARATIYATIATLISSSCNDNNVIDSSNTPIQFRTTTAATTITRGNPIEGDERPSEVAIYAIDSKSPDALFMDNVLLTPNASYTTWSYSEPHYWDEVDKLTVYGYSPQADNTKGISIDDTNNNLILTYTVPTDVTLQPDLMISKPLIEHGKIENALPLQMNHALTAIGFITNGAGEKITAIGARNVYTRGDINIKSDNIVWYNLSSPSNELYAEQTNHTTIADQSGNVVTSNNGYLMMIPQTTPSGAELFAIVDGVERTVDISNTTWRAGKRIDYELKLRRGWMLADFTADHYPDYDQWIVLDVTANYSSQYEGICRALKTISENTNREIEVIFPHLQSLTGKAFYAFLSARSLTAFRSIKLPVATSLGMESFMYCDDLESIDAPQVTSVANHCFLDCDKLTTVNLPSVINLESGAFKNSDALETITLPSATTLSTSVFQNCDGLKTVNLPKATTIEMESFKWCDNLITINAPKLTTISTRLFTGCLSLVDIELESVCKIENEGFESCPKLETVKLPNLMDIGREAFLGCNALRELDFTSVSSRTLNNIETSAFSNFPDATLTIGKVGSKIIISGNTIQDTDCSDIYTFKQINH